MESKKEKSTALMVREVRDVMIREKELKMRWNGIIEDDKAAK